MNYKLHTDRIEQGDGFICLPGAQPYIQIALDKGAQEILLLNRIELASFGNRLFNDPSRKLCVIGITGTNGKTTVSKLVADALNGAGYKAMVQGTLTSRLTTPESFETLQNMATHLHNGGTHFVMEVSSHAIDQGRILGIDFDIRLLTNITQDHLDYHKTFEAYKRTKLSFLEASSSACIYPEHFESISIAYEIPLMGAFNVKNAQATIAILRECRVDEGVIQSNLQKASPPPGRFEPIAEGQPYHVVVDYAHTPDGLDNILKTGKEMAGSHQLIVVFGCGGNRDRLKRPLMASVAQRYATTIIVTSDNPREESCDQIMSDIKQGFTTTHAVLVVPDRHVAIDRAIGQAREGDVVIIAGKGHETVQIIGTTHYPFDDRLVARQAIQKRHF